MRIQRLISENPVIIFSRSSCCMCHVMKHLLLKNGVHPTVIELEEDEIGAMNNNPVAPAVDGGDGGGGDGGTPALYIGGALVGGLKDLVALHLSGDLVPKLIEVGVRENNMVL
ncbi:Glutaredoxin-C6 [Abeliophyllum distichum]|uniref:Glutaredoxin-C6 n=1 Tax=Abeliophyllum distichum TaxID=126358 RepID=A0ABD1TYT3_9LAMI